MAAVVEGASPATPAAAGGSPDQPHGQVAEVQAPLSFLDYADLVKVNRPLAMAALTALEAAADVKVAVLARIPKELLLDVFKTVLKP